MADMQQTCDYTAFARACQPHPAFAVPHDSLWISPAFTVRIGHSLKTRTSHACVRLRPGRALLLLKGIGSTVMDNLWQNCLATLEGSINPSQFNIWIKPLTATLDADTLTIGVPNQIFLQFIRERFLSQI